MRIEFLYDIVAIYNNSNIKKAAKEIGISDTTLRTHIELMEKELGQNIFIYEGAKVKLTDEGYSFYKYAAKVLQELNAYRNRFSFKEKPNKITIGVDVNVLLGYLYICSKLVADELNVKFNIVQLYKENILNGISEEIFDAGLVVIDKETKEKIKDYGLKYEVICTRRPVVIVSNNHPLSKKEDVSIEELIEYKRISLKDSFEEYYFWGYCRNDKVQLQRSNIMLKYLGDVLIFLRNDEFYYIGGINEDEEKLLKGLKVLEIRELKERSDVGYVYYKNRALLDPIKRIIDVRKTFKKE